MAAVSALFAALAFIGRPTFHDLRDPATSILNWIARHLFELREEVAVVAHRTSALCGAISTSSSGRLSGSTTRSRPCARTCASFGWVKATCAGASRPWTERRGARKSSKPRARSSAWPGRSRRNLRGLAARRRRLGAGRAQRARHSNPGAGRASGSARAPAWGSPARARHPEIINKKAAPRFRGAASRGRSIKASNEGLIAGAGLSRVWVRARQAGPGSERPANPAASPDPERQANPADPDPAPAARS